MLGIELDDPSHENRERFERDIFVNELFASAGVPLLRLPVEDLHEVEKLIETLTHAWQHRWALLETGMSPPKSRPKRRFIDRLMGKAQNDPKAF